MMVVIAGGGTGGHLFPGFAVAEELLARGHQARFVGTARGLEARLCPQKGFALDLIDVTGLKRKSWRELASSLARLPRALGQSLALLRRHHPDVVVGVGGYASGPLVLAAALAGRPTAILEQNSVPGMTNRILGRLVERVFGAFAAAARFFPRRKFLLVGNPVRRQLLEAKTAPAAREFRLLALGGSQGAHAVNELVSEAMQLLAAEGRAPRLLHQSGAADVAALRRKYAEAGLMVELRDFIDDMGAAYRSAALVISRAGASTLAELTALGLPALLIPFPSAADDHQTENARELEAAGAARLLKQEETTPRDLARIIAALAADPAELERMSAASRRLGRPRAHVEIVDALEQMARDA